MRIFERQLKRFRSAAAKMGLFGKARPQLLVWIIAAIAVKVFEQAERVIYLENWVTLE